jgi:hypothetical protein
MKILNNLTKNYSNVFKNKLVKKNFCMTSIDKKINFSMIRQKVLVVSSHGRTLE